MKNNKIIYVSITAVLGILIFALGFNYKTNEEPRTYYQVYLEDEILGLITSKEDLLSYIDKQNASLKEQYHVDKVYEPNNLKIQKVVTYENNLLTIEEAYALIQKKAPFTVKGYQLTVHGDEELKFYVIDPTVFNESVEGVMETFIGTKAYQNYKNNTQEENATGVIIENAYIEEDITIKEVQISVNEKIYTDKKELTTYLLYSGDLEESEYVVKKGDTIKSIAFANEVSTEELFMANPDYTSENNLVYPGQIFKIVKTSPKINVVSEVHSVEDKESKYRIEEQHDAERLKDDNEVIQKGESGIQRVTQKIKYVNGIVTYSTNVSTMELKPSISEIVIMGDKVIPNVGSLYSWYWPTLSYNINSPYGYRIDPITGDRRLHGGLDIQGNYGSPVYATNNGTVIEAEHSGTLGIHIIINHNNGYYSVYGHMQKIDSSVKVGRTVSSGQYMGEVGSTGKSTGPHLHFEIWKNCSWCRVNPWDYLW